MNNILHAISIILIMVLTYEMMSLSHKCHKLKAKIADIRVEHLVKERSHIKKASKRVEMLENAKEHIDDHDYALKQINKVIEMDHRMLNIVNID